MSESKLIMLDNRILVLPEDSEKITKSGIIIPDTAAEQPRFGRVLEIGVACEHIVKGDLVVYGQFAGSELRVNGKDCKWMRESDVICLADKFDGFKI